MTDRYTKRSQRWRDRKNFADISFLRYVCPIGENNHRVQVPGCENETIVSSAAGRTSFAPGAKVTVGSHAGGRTQVVLGLPPPGQAGSSQYPIQEKVAALDSVGIASADPDVLASGSSGNSVTVYGFGFKAGDVWDAVKWVDDEWVEDGLITVSLDSVVDGSEVNVTIGVGAVGDEYLISLRVSR